jgi:hypothetical protein
MHRSCALVVVFAESGGKEQADALVVTQSTIAFYREEPPMHAALILQSAEPTFSVSLLRWALIGGALLDFVGAFMFMFFTGRAQSQLQLPKETEFWPKYASVFLIVLGVLYCVTAINPIRSLANVGVAIMGRVLGAVFYFRWCRITPGVQGRLFLLAVLNVLLALVYFLILGAPGRALLWDSLRPLA